MPPNYQLSKIYKIESLSTGLIYIGSTVQPLSKRMTGHRSNLIQFKKGNGNYMTALKVLECEDSEILLLEDFPCERKEQLLAREGEWVRKMNCVNKNIPGRTLKQWQDENADKIKEQQRQYYNKNADKIKEQQKQYNCENANKRNEQRKLYRQKNADKLKERRKIYYKKKLESASI
jgi:hypothetical protein